MNKKLNIEERDLKIIQLFCFVLRDMIISQGFLTMYSAIEDYINWYNQHYQFVEKEEILEFKRKLSNLIK